MDKVVNNANNTITVKEVERKKKFITKNLKF